MFTKPPFALCGQPYGIKHVPLGRGVPVFYWNDMNTTVNMQTVKETDQQLFDYIVAQFQEMPSFMLIHEFAVNEARRITMPPTGLSYSKWRHGGWYVHAVRYPSGACGCVSNNYVDEKWRIVEDDRRVGLNEEGDFSFKTRDMAAIAEHALCLDKWREAFNKSIQPEGLVDTHFKTTTFKKLKASRPFQFENNGPVFIKCKDGYRLGCGGAFVACAPDKVVLPYNSMWEKTCVQHE